jgi:hypothetical protein
VAPNGQPWPPSEQGFPIINISGLIGIGDSSAASNIDDSRTYQVIIDLYTFTLHYGNSHYIDHVHFDPATRALQAAFIAGYLDSWLHGKRSKI